jgi:arsenate reductase (thioredoxin)
MRIYRRSEVSDTVHILFLCTGNSARSIIAEAILNYRGAARFAAFSAGSHPAGSVRPDALAVLSRHGIPTAAPRSKSWSEFASPGAPRLDIVVTVCDNAAKESCPIWPGAPISTHWGVPDPAAVSGSPEAVTRAYEAAFDILERRIDCLIGLPAAEMDRVELKRALDRIGKI